MEPVAVIHLENRPVGQIIQEIQNHKIQAIASIKRHQQTLMNRVRPTGKSEVATIPPSLKPLKQMNKMEDIKNIQTPKFNTFKAPAFNRPSVTPNIKAPNFTPSFKAPSVNPGFTPSFKAPSFTPSFGGFGRR